MTIDYNNQDNSLLGDDKPIESPAKDKLARSELAHKLVDHIKEFRNHPLTFNK